MPEEKKKQKRNLDFSFTQNRELSWLKFNQRVLEEATDPNVPLYERMKFLSIFTSNLDEFFMVRVGSLYDMSLVKHPHIDNKSGMTPQEQLHAIFKAVAPLYKKRDKAFVELEELLRQHDVFHLSIKEMESKERKFVENYFKTYVYPILSPQVIDLRHPFPHILNQSLYIAMKLKGRGKEYYGIVPIPANLPKVVFLPGNSTRYVLLEAMVLEYAQRIFPMYTTTEKAVICVTRNADINPDDEQFDVDDDYRHHMKKVLKKRARLAPVRLQIQGEASACVVDFLAEHLQLKKDQVFRTKAPISMSYIFLLQEYFSPAKQKVLTYKPFFPKWSATLTHKEGMISQVAKKDLLLFYPYESMEPFLELIREASEDPAVVSIKITIYRLASKSKLVEYLTRAVENSKEVIVLMELRARFDEENNINWSGELENAGCQVIYGFEGYKVHSKVCLITRRDHGKVQYITQIGTGNYNEKTAALYTDFSLMTVDPEIGADAAAFFQNMAISNLHGDYQHLLVAPSHLKSGILRCIQSEIKQGDNGSIFMKMNSLTDRDIIDRLAEASQAGVKVDLIIRGICCLLPGIPGKTENITVTSVVGRFLEHPRIYCFGKDIEEMKIFLGSADMMTRNTQRRVEVLAPVRSHGVKRQLLNLVEIMRRDTIKARVLQPNGSYQKKPLVGAIAIDSQAYFIDLANTQAAAVNLQNTAKKSFWKRFREKRQRKGSL